MSKKILNSKILYALLAIAIAFGLWFYVATVEEPDGEIEINGIPITFTNQEVLAENNLIISDGLNQTATLRVAGNRTTLAKLNNDREKIALTIDVSRITTPGQQRIAYSIKLPAGYESSVTVVSRYPSNIDFTVSRRIDKEVAVKGEFVGTLAEKYMLGEFRILPGKIAISGIESDVNRISHALVTVSGEQLTTTFSGEMGFDLIDYQGNELTDLDVQCSVETVSVTMPVLKTADVPLSVKLIAGGGVTDTEKNVECTISPEYITVSGDEDDLDPLKEIVLGEIELADIIGTETFTFDIPLAPELENITGVTTATVTVTIRGLSSKILDVTDIELIHVPEGFSAQSVTQSLQVLVRGEEEHIDRLLSLNLRAVADLSNIDPVAGRYTVPVKIYVAGSGVGVVGDEYKIVVDVIVPARTVEEIGE